LRDATVTDSHAPRQRQAAAVGAIPGLARLGGDAADPRPGHLTGPDVESG